MILNSENISGPTLLYNWCGPLLCNIPRGALGQQPVTGSSINTVTSLQVMFCQQINLYPIFKKFSPELLYFRNGERNYFNLQESNCQQQCCLVDTYVLIVTLRKEKEKNESKFNNTFIYYIIFKYKLLKRYFTYFSYCIFEISCIFISQRNSVWTSNISCVQCFQNEEYRTM